MTRFITKPNSAEESETPQLSLARAAKQHQSAHSDEYQAMHQTRLARFGLQSAST